MLQKNVEQDIYAKEKKLLSPKMDVTFQVLFGEVGSEEITKEFLKAILKEKITKVDLSKNPILRRMRPNDKMGILDVIVEIDQKELCNIEMQLATREDIIQRILYYWGRIYSRDIHKKEDYSTLKRTIVILIAGFEIKGLEELEYLSKWQLIEVKGRKTILTDYLEIDIIELPKIYKRNTNKKDDLLDWLYFLEDPESKEVVKIMEQNEGVKKAKDKLEEISQDEIMQRLADWQENLRLDQAYLKRMAIKEGKEEGRREGIIEGKREGKKQGIEEGRKEGIIEGRKEGRKKGRKEGIKEGIIEIAKNLKKQDNITVEFIMKVTNLSKEEIENL